MVDQVAKALCEAAGKSIYHDADKTNSVCSCCDRQPDNRCVCIYWETYRGEARAAIAAAYLWHKENRRWPSWLNSKG